MAPDVVIFSPATIRKALTRRFPRVPMIYLPHSRIAPEEVRGVYAGSPSHVQRFVARWSHLFAERRALVQSAATVRFTPGLADVLVSYYRLPLRTKFAIIPQAVEVPMDAPPPRTGPLRVLAIGRLIESKNVGLVLSALAGQGGAWHFDVVGDGPERSRLEMKVRADGLTDRVTFHGQQDDPGPFYRAADVLAFPSRLENVSLVMLEAMGHGVPAVVIRSGGAGYQNSHHEVMRNGVDGLIADGEVEFTHMLRRAVADPQTVRSLAAAARTAAVRHAWPAALDRWEELLCQVTGRPELVRPGFRPPCPESICSVY
jgi:glycosyltransferase involved in cell wall biosynthesis